MSDHLNIACVLFSKSEADIFSHLKTFFNLKITSQNLSLAEAVKSKSTHIILIGNENLDTSIAVGQKIRENNCFTPILLCSKEDPTFSEIISDLEYAHIMARPFKSLDILKYLNDFINNAEELKKVCQLRTNIEILIRKNQFKSAVEQLKALKFKISQLALNITYADILFKTKNYEKAINTINSNPDSIKSMRGKIIKAYCFHHLKRNKNAIEIINEGISLCPKFYKYYICKGDIALAEDHLTEAIKLYSQALSIRKDSSLALDGLIAAFLISGNLKEIQRHIDKNNFFNTIARVANSKGIELVESSYFEQAEKMYANILEHLSESPYSYKFYLNLGICMKKAKKYNKALYYFKLSDEKAPTDFFRAKEQIAQLQKLLSTPKV